MAVNRSQSLYINQFLNFISLNILKQNGKLFQHITT